MGKTKRTPVLIHLDPEKAEQLADLASETNTMKSVLLRDAVDLLLARRGKLEPSPEIEFVTQAVRQAREVITKYRTEARGSVWIQRCNSALESLDEALGRLKQI